MSTIQEINQLAEAIIVGEKELIRSSNIIEALTIKSASKLVQLKETRGTHITCLKRLKELRDASVVSLLEYRALIKSRLENQLQIDQYKVEIALIESKVKQLQALQIQMAEQIRLYRHQLNTEYGQLEVFPRK